MVLFVHKKNTLPSWLAILTGPPAPHRLVERQQRLEPREAHLGQRIEVIEQRGLVKVMLIIFNRPTPVDLEYWQVERL